MNMHFVLGLYVPLSIEMLIILYYNVLISCKRWTFELLTVRL